MYRELTLDEIHNETLKLLCEFHKLCEKLNLKYYLAYGTLLGAVRHKGFIPWDDDADIWMPRDDYNKLLDYYDKNQQDFINVKICNRKNTKYYIYGISRFADTRYKYIATGLEKQVDIGIFIDLYPLDNYCDDLKKSKKMVKKINRINLSYSLYVNSNSSKIVKKIIKKSMYLLLHLIHGKKYKYKVDEKIYNIVKKYTSENNKYVGVPVWSQLRVPNLYEKNDFKERILLEFSGCYLYCPKGYDNILKKCYGDYMKLPPEEDRHPYHNYKIVME